MCKVEGCEACYRVHSVAVGPLSKWSSPSQTHVWGSERLAFSLAITSKFTSSAWPFPWDQ
jgi:hypothetical protein